MPILEVYRVIIVPYFIWQIIYIGSSMFGQKKYCVICFRANDDFKKNSTLQLFYHDDMANAKKGHYEPITFYNASWEVNQQQCPLNDEVKNDLYLCVELMIICTHKNKNIKYDMKR